MAENTTATETQKNEGQSAQQVTEHFNSLPDTFREAITKLNEQIKAHNNNVTAVRAADKSKTDPIKIKAEIREQNDSGNKKIARINDEIAKLDEKREQLIKQANEIIDAEGLMPKDRSEEEIAKLKDEVKESAKSLRDSISAVENMSAMMGVGDVTQHLNDVSTLRGIGKSGGAKSSGGAGTKRPRFSKILVNGVTEKDGDTVYQKVKNAKTGEYEEKYTFTFAAQFLGKQARDINWGAKDLQDAYFNSLPEGHDADNMPDEHKFVMPHVYKDEKGNEQTVNYEITAIK